MTVKPKRKRIPIGKTNPKKNRRYYLWVKFLPQYQLGQETCTYNNSKLNKLIDKANEFRSRYALSKLVDRMTGNILGIYTHEGVFTVAEWEKRKEEISNTAPLLRASMAFKPDTLADRLNNKKSALLTVTPLKNTNFLAAINDIRQIVLTGPYQYDFERVFIYHGETNEKVAVMDNMGAITPLSVAFAQQIKDLNTVQI